jgi:arginase
LESLFAVQPEFILTPFFLDQPLSLLETLADPAWAINKPQLPDGDAQSRMSILHEALARKVEKSLKNGKLPVSIAGDCCTSIGVTAGLQRAGVDPFLIWFDAHGDFNTWDTTPSGFLGGMPLAMLSGLGEQTMPRAVNLQPLSQDKIILTDGRDLDPGETELVANSGMTHLVDPKSLYDHTFPDLPTYIHLDVDIINPLDAPGMSYAAAGGPRASELEDIFRFLAQTLRIVAISMSSWNPDLDADGETKKTSMDLLWALLNELQKRQK